MDIPPPTEKQARVIWMALTGLAMATIILLIVAAIWGLGQVLRILSPVLWPLAIAGVLAYLLDPVVDFLERRKIPRTRAILVVFGCATLLTLGLAGSVVPQLVVETGELVERIPADVERVQDRIEKWAKNPPAPLRKLFERKVGVAGTNAPATAPAPGENATAEAPSFWSNVFGTDTFKSAADWLAKATPKIGSWLIGQLTGVASFLGLIIGLALVPIYAFYFLLEKKGIASKWTDYLPVSGSGFKDELVFVIRAINDHLVAFFRGQVLVACSDGFCYTIGFLIVGLHYSVLLGVMATCLTMIPFLGAMITCAAALLVAFIQFGDWQHPLAVLATFGVVQTLEGFVIQPRIMGDRVGLHPLTIVIAVVIGTTVLGGVLGGILAIPMTATGKVLMLRYVWKKR